MTKLIKQSVTGRERVLLIGAVPPPAHGVAIVIQHILRSPRLSKQFDIKHLDISDHRAIDNIGRWDRTNLRLAFLHWVQLIFMLMRYRPRLVHIPLAQNYPGLLRDWTLLITVLAFPRAKAVGHVAGGGFAQFLLHSPLAFRLLVEPSIKRCATLIVSSEWQQKQVAQALPRQHYSLVRRGTECIDVDGTRSQDEAPEILFANSSLTREKGVFDLLRAAEICQAQNVRARWSIVGAFLSESDEAYVRTVADNLQAVDVIGPLKRDALFERYKRAHVFLFLPGPKEAFGLVRVEAMAAGLPVVSTTAGGAREVIDDGYDGFIVQYARPDQVARQVTQLVNSPDLRAAMGARARAKQRRCFSIDTFETALADTWAAVAHRRAHD